MTEKPIIDCHHHLVPDPDCAAKLVDECAPAGNRGKAYLARWPVVVGRFV